MKEIRITRAFLKKPLYNALILCTMATVFESIQWSAAYSIKFTFFLRAGGLFPYILVIIRELFVPELVTLFILLALIQLYHEYFHIYTIKSDWRSIVSYEIKFLPLLVVAFPIFNPVTQTFRFILVEYPDYSWPDYWNGYILYTFSWGTYFQYLFPIILLGYIPLNISLLQDYLSQRKVNTPQEVIDELHSTLFQSHTQVISSSYLTSLKGRNAQGELDFPVNDAYYFTIEDRLYYAELAKGRYLISKTLNELEAELDPRQFFRIKRDYIVNRQAVLSYAHWENGKYIVRLNTPKSQDIVIPRTRMQELREWLQKDIQVILELS